MSSSSDRRAADRRAALGADAGPAPADAPALAVIPPLAGRGRRATDTGRRLAAFALLAILAQAGSVGGMVEAPRLARLLGFHGHHPPPPGAPPTATIELIEQNTPTVGGSRPTTATTPATPRPTASPKGGAPDALASKAAPDTLDRPAPTAARATPSATAAPATTAAATATASAAAPEVNLDIDGEPGTGLVSGPNVIPASPDTRHPNAPPAYPRAAALRHEEGTVALVVSIAPDGHADAVDVAVSSGYPALDDAARRAVSRWHFRPAVEDGRQVPSVFNEQIQFSLTDHPP